MGNTDNFSVDPSVYYKQIGWSIDFYTCTIDGDSHSAGVSKSFTRLSGRLRRVGDYHAVQADVQYRASVRRALFTGMERS